MRKLPTTCPSCDSHMTITELACPECSTRVQGTFEGSNLLRLNAEQMYFVEVFLRSRGNIKEVERDLKISYPTVRSRLDQVIESLGYPAPPKTDGEASALIDDVLDGLQRGDLTFDMAVKIIQERKPIG